jgi:hypothetical protein
MILQKACEYNVDIHQLHIDYEQAYNSINRAHLVEVMKEFGIPKKLVRFFKMTLENTRNKVKIQGKLSPNFEMVVGLRQGDSLSTLLFNLCMEKIIRNVKTNLGGAIFNRTRQCLAYADDVVILGPCVRYILETLEDMAVVATQNVLSMNNTKLNTWLIERIIIIMSQTKLK